ncbi:MAG: DUF1998 domain-containing protein, partial [Trebonia sp.]
RTEALRILLPVATMFIQERVASFAAALMAGVAAKYGGDPDHLQAEPATMPDHQGSGRRRRFLVLYDTLPGGTGYLHRLADQAELKDVLEKARGIIAACPCAEEGKRACHRCLLSHISDDVYELVSRADALEMLNDLLEGWETGSVADTREISLWEQVESELEARFHKALRDWAQSQGSVSLSGLSNAGDRKAADLRITLGDGQVAHWQVMLQNTIEGTRPDVLFKRVDGDPLDVAVYLDGYAYHAAPKKNRLASDADTRARLRASGTVVFQFDWYDIDEMAGDANGIDKPWPPYQGNAQQTAKGAYARLGEDPAQLEKLVWSNPVSTLFAFLSDPDPRRWRRAATAAVAGLLAVPGAERTDFSAERTMVSLLGHLLPPGGAERILVRVRDTSGCQLTVVVDQRDRDSESPLGYWTALTVIDDRADIVRADEVAHQRRWAAWLYWGNLVQFLTSARADGGQLAYTALDSFDPATLAVAGGAGLLSTYGVTRDSVVETSVWAAGLKQPGVSADASADTVWGGVLGTIDVEVGELGLELAGRGVPAPDEIGYELGNEGWQAELAWYDPVSVAVIAAGPESAECIAAYVAADWDARLARDWPADELAEKILGGDR